jgi:hypothetical protein
MDPSGTMLLDEFHVRERLSRDKGCAMREREHCRLASSFSGAHADLKTPKAKSLANNEFTCGMPGSHVGLDRNDCPPIPGVRFVGLLAEKNPNVLACG